MSYPSDSFTSIRSLFRSVFLKKYFFSVPVDLQPLIVEEGVKQGSKADWEFVLEKYKNAKIPSQKFLLLGALTGTTDLRLINRFKAAKSQAFYKIYLDQYCV